MLRAAQAAAAVVVLRRLARGRVRHPPLEASAPPAGVSVSVVVPARDEAERIGPCLEGLAADPDLLEVIVVDDRSSDGTAAVARATSDARVRVIEGSEPPAGWIGKPWALQQGLEAATGDVLVCVDADTRPRAGLAGALAALAQEQTWVTAGTRFVCETAGERLLHPAMLASLVYRYGPGDSDPPPPRILANGQCTAVRRDDLVAVGGYVGGLGHLTDDAALARSLAGQGWEVVFRDGGDLVEVKMHDSVREAWREWGRSLALADVEPLPRRIADLATVWLVMALPWTGRGRALLLVRLALLAGLRGSYTVRGPAYWLSPLADPLVAVRLTWSTLRPTRTWRGRTYAP